MELIQFLWVYWENKGKADLVGHCSQNFAEEIAHDDDDGDESNKIEGYHLEILIQK